MSKIENLCSAILCDSARNGRKEPSSFSEVGGEVIRARLRDFRKRVRSLYDPFDIVAHHRLRIAVKRLRYSVQLFSEAFEGDSETVSREIARMQRHLGEMHDCDVWLRGLKKYMNRRPNHREAESKNLAAAEWLIAEFAAERGKAYRDAVELWARWRSDRFPERIESLAS
jgi:CHAD domain-containing protein